MLDFSPVKRKEIRFSEFIADISVTDLHDLTNKMVDAMLDLISDGTDADVVFLPDDPEAHDKYAEEDAVVDLAWTLGHVIVHTTASAEENAFLAAELARGVALHGRSRFEVPWETVQTIVECRQRLEESRRMRLASLAMWPDEPHLDPLPGTKKVSAVGQFVLGLWHDDSHLGQIEEIMRQARAARAG